MYCAQCGSTHLHLHSEVKHAVACSFNHTPPSISVPAMDHPVKRRRVAEPDRPADANDFFDDYDSDDELTLADLDAFDQRVRQAKLSKGKGKDDRRLLHRRQAVVTADLTVAVESTVTVAVEVNDDGQPTTTFSLPSVPSVPAFPSDLTVPSVPAFPTAALPTVPSVPLVPTTLVAATAANSNTQVIFASPPATPLPTAANNGTTVPSSITSSVSAFATFSAPRNGEMVYITITSLRTADQLIGTASVSSTGMSNLLIASNSSSASAMSTGFWSGNSSLIDMNSMTLSSPTLLTSVSSSSSSGLPTTATGGAGAAGSGSGQTGTSPNGAGSSGSGNNNGGSNNNGTPPAGLVAGAVTGSVGGAAILLLILVILVRWLRRRNAAIGGLPRDESSITGLRPGGGAGPGMSQRSILPAAAAGALARLSTMARPKSSPTLPPQAQGFQKISGRKMPSQFGSEFDQGPMAMDFAAAAVGRPQRNTADTSFSDRSFYRDSQGFYGGLGESPERPAGPLAGGFAGPSTRPPQTAPSPETMRPSPARTPTIHQSGFGQTPPTTSSTLTPRQAETSTLGRTHQDGSHSTRFTEDL